MTRLSEEEKLSRIAELKRGLKIYSRKLDELRTRLEPIEVKFAKMANEKYHLERSLIVVKKLPIRGVRIGKAIASQQVPVELSDDLTALLATHGVTLKES